MLAGFIVPALHGVLNNHLFFQLSDKLIQDYDQNKNLQKTATALPTLCARFPERAPQDLHFNIDRQAGISLLELGNDAALPSEEVMNTSLFRLKDTFYFKARLFYGLSPT